MEPSQGSGPQDIGLHDQSRPLERPAGPRGLARRVAVALRRAVRRALAKSAEGAEPFMVSAGALGMVGQPLFYIIWTYIFPQAYESLPIRLFAAVLCVPLVLKRYWPQRLLPWLPLNWVLAVFVNIPLLYSYFLLQNHLSQVWLLTMIGGIFMLAFLVELVTAGVSLLLGAVLAYAAFRLGGGGSAVHSEVLRADYVQVLLIELFPLVFGGMFAFQLQRYREQQHAFDRRLRSVTTQHARVVREQNNLLSRFLSNVIVERLRKFQLRHGLDEAIDRITRQEQRFCGIMQADVRNFTKMFGEESEFVVAQQIRRCFSEITEVGQDLAVIKPVGDCIFVYTDDELGRQAAVHNILSLAIFFVHTLERVNRMLRADEPAALNFGIAVHAGEVIYGNLASDTLIDPTIIGINVNRTARMEELTKAPAVRDRVGPNAIICSDEIVTQAGQFIRPEHLVPLRLKELGLTLRDFPHVERVWGLRAELALTYLEQALAHIQDERKRFGGGVSQLEANRYRGMTYYYEMQGMGPNTTWLALIDVSTLPARLVNRFVATELTDLMCEVNHTDGQWLIVSTRDQAGELDESDLEARIFQIIDGLEQASQQPSA